MTEAQENYKAKQVNSSISPRESIKFHDCVHEIKCVCVYVCRFDTVLHHMEKSEVFPFRHIFLLLFSYSVDEDGFRTKCIYSSLTIF